MPKSSSATVAGSIADVRCATSSEQALTRSIAADAPWLSKQQVRELIERHTALQAQIKSLEALRDAIVLVGVLGIAFGLGVHLS